MCATRYPIPPSDRALRERLCRYVSRPPLAQGRLSLTDDGQVLWKLPSPGVTAPKPFASIPSFPSHRFPEPAPLESLPTEM